MPDFSQGSPNQRGRRQIKLLGGKTLKKDPQHPDSPSRARHTRLNQYQTLQRYNFFTKPVRYKHMAGAMGNHEWCLALHGYCLRRYSTSPAHDNLTRLWRFTSTAGIKRVWFTQVFYANGSWVSNVNWRTMHKKISGGNLHSSHSIMGIVESSNRYHHVAMKTPTRN